MIRLGYNNFAFLTDYMEAFGSAAKKIALLALATAHLHARSLADDKHLTSYKYQMIGQET